MCMLSSDCLSFSSYKIFSMLSHTFPFALKVGAASTFCCMTEHLISTFSSATISISEIKARKKQSEKDLGFLRIGSLNVRVKKTTEAFSNFLGKSQSSVEKIHKSWGSADNIQQNDNKTMPPPKFAPIKKRKSKKAQDFMSHSTPSTPDLRDVSSAESKFSDLKDTANAQDSDSDTACGFGSNWQP